LFAGDPKQLAPIVQSDNAAAIRWLGRSIFARMNEKSASTCLLNEQSRMAEPICSLVSNLFYTGRLVIAADCKGDRNWEKERELHRVVPIGSRRVHCEDIPADGKWSQKYHGPIRMESAKFICDLLAELTESLDPSSIVVLTPFRAQRALIRVMLKKAELSRVAVSTVHRAQGSERHTVIFDPVQGDGNFLMREDGPRLVNVAISRAKARLVIVLSSGDRKNDLLDRLAHAIVNTNDGKASRGAVPVKELIQQGDFPFCAVNKAVSIGTIVGRVIGVLQEGKRFELIEFSTGVKKIMDTAVVKKNFG
jgi:superfamily I DNA and/or RNA helicase